MKLKLTILVPFWMLIGLFLTVNIYADSYPTKVNLNTNLVDEETSQVAIDYTFHLGGETETLPFKALLLFDTTIEDINVTINGEASEVDFEIKDDNSVSGEIHLDENTLDSSEVDVEIQYQVLGALTNDNEEFEINIPVLSSKLAPPEASVGFFNFNVELPDNASVTGGFPTRYNLDESNRVSSDLQTMSSLLKFEGSIGSNPFFTLNRVMDFSVVLFLVVVGVGTFFVQKRKPSR